jgi:hypothetical protein
MPKTNYATAANDFKRNGSWRTKSHRGQDGRAPLWGILKEESGRSVIGNQHTRIDFIDLSSPVSSPARRAAVV